MTDLDLVFLPATELAALLRAKQVSARELLDAHLRQIARVNPRVNAIVTLTAEQGRGQALEADEALVHGRPLGQLHGLPVAHKDLHETRGVRTTYGSRAFEHFVPDFDNLLVERVRLAGGVMVGKTNTPELGAGSQTFNDVSGETRNPYDVSRTCGGSSGGSAVALACGMAALAGGSDMGGSLRNHASFCNVVGLRPSPGRVPSWPAKAAWSTLSVDGPMGRTVGDVALMLSAIAGPDARSPISIDEPAARFAGLLERRFDGVRVAWTRGFGLPFEPAVTHAVESQRRVVESLGCVVEDAEPDLAEADEVFRVLRAWAFQMAHAETLARHRALLKDTVVWNIEEGERLSGPDVARAERMRTALYHRLRVFMERYDFFVLPVVQVLPFDVSVRYPSEVAGVRMDTYIDWMKSCYVVSVTGHPALSVPCGFSPEGLPVGLQIVGRHRDDWGVLQLGHAFEQATGCWRRRPAVAE